MNKTMPKTILNSNNHGDPEVIEFIRTFAAYKHALPSEQDALRELFLSGYCYYFAHMLKTAFGDGEVYICAPYGHFVWGRKYNNAMIYYDIEGVSITEADYYIPESYLGNMVLDFKRLPGKRYNATELDIKNLIDRYLIDTDNKR